MKALFEERYGTSPEDVKHYDTEKLRSEFLIEEILVKGLVKMLYTHNDRMLVGGAIPLASPLKLEAIDALKAEYFCQRRELGIINVGGSGSVVVDGQAYELQYKEALYVGQGVKQVEFMSKDATVPAKFYFNSAPAHCSYPTVQISRADANVLDLGSVETSNKRIVNQLIISKNVQTCQLQMGLTELKTGSVWNSMPPHTHARRMEVYFYFEVPENQSVCHFMGKPDETRHIWIKNEEAVISPSWSIHAGAGTSNYSFIWGMCGENMDYGDMDTILPNQLL